MCWQLATVEKVGHRFCIPACISLVFGVSFSPLDQLIRNINCVE